MCVCATAWMSLYMCCCYYYCCCVCWQRDEIAVCVLHKMSVYADIFTLNRIWNILIERPGSLQWITHFPYRKIERERERNTYTHIFLMDFFCLTFSRHQNSAEESERVNVMMCNRDGNKVTFCEQYGVVGTQILCAHRLSTQSSHYQPTIKKIMYSL